MKSYQLCYALCFAGLVACSGDVKGGAQSPADTTGGSGATGGSIPGTGGSTGGTSGSSGRGGKGGTGGTGGAPQKTPPQVAPRFAPGDCNLDHPAFCDNFEKPSPGGRGGDIDETQWSFARFGSGAGRFFVRGVSMSDDPALAETNVPTFCNQTFSGLLPPDDVKFCDGVDGGGFASRQLNEAMNDNTGFGINSMRIRQLFDFTGRTGTLVFDLDAKVNDGFGGHGWWTELWITEDPAPMPYHQAPTVGSFPRRGLGFIIQPHLNDCFQGDYDQVGKIVITDNYQVVREDGFTGEKCFHAADTKLNRFKFAISTDRIDVWVSDANAPGKMNAVGTITGLNLNFSRGYIHLQHSQYNAYKDGHSSPSQTFRWDNVGFDGPTYAVPRSYDVPDEGQVIIENGKPADKTIGYYLGRDNQPPTPHKFTLSGVDLTNADSAVFNFNFHGPSGATFRYRFNGNAWHDFTVNSILSAPMLRANTVTVPLNELVQGDNTLEVTLPGPVTDHQVIGNMDLTVTPSK